MKTTFNKIVIVSLCDDFSKKIAEKLSQSLGMLFCDTKDLIEYELIDRDALKQFSTSKYLAQAEKKVVKHIASFENVVVAINYDYLVHNFNILKNGSLTVFLKLPKSMTNNTLSQINYASRTQELEKLATLSVGIRKTDEDFVIKKIIKEIGGIL